MLNSRIASRDRGVRYRRTAAKLRHTLQILCDMIWNNGQPKQGDHLWSIPVDRVRDFDCIIADGIKELEMQREFVQRARKLLERYTSKAYASLPQRERTNLFDESLTWIGDINEFESDWETEDADED